VTDLSAGGVADELRGRIHRGELGPGDRLAPERELAVELDISRDRLREAIAVLVGDGYLVSRRGAAGGHFVTELAAPFRVWATRMAGELDDIVDFRLAVECQAVRFAATRRRRSDLRLLRSAVDHLAAATTPRAYRLADVDFHARLAAASRNQRLVAAVERARGELFEPADALWEHGRIESLADHTRILGAVEAGDATLAAAAMADHIEVTRQELRALIRTLPG
jgi:GntR family transcriptional regulator, transcriptional repressor for pyruvate dehydrogenase complex